MKKILITVCLLMATAVAIATPVDEMKNNTIAQYKIMVISDIHLLAPALHDDGQAAVALDSGDMKLVLESDLVMEKMAHVIESEKPSLLLITGDLTLNGARASHKRLVEHLKQLKLKGVKTLVIPGNHDVLCPYSRSYLGDKAQPVATVTAQEFATLYQDSGYGCGSERDPSSLSYVCEPLPGLVVLGIDSNRYSENRSVTWNDSVTVYNNGGIVKGSTLEWIAGSEILRQARASGKKVIAMMHHHLVEHIDGEAKMLPNYIVSNNEQVCQQLQQVGVRAVFTGHLHITDAATWGGTITDVATGSASAFPLPMRIATISQRLDTMTISTRFLDKDIDNSILQKSLSKINNSAPALAAIASRRLWARMGKQMGAIKEMLASQGVDLSHFPQDEHDLQELILRHMQQPLSQSLLAITCGDEQPQQASSIIDAIRKGLQSMVAEVIPEQVDTVGEFLVESLMPRVEPLLRSALEDINQLGSPQESRTPDLSLKIAL